MRKSQEGRALRQFTLKEKLVRISIVVLFLFSVFTLCYFFSLVLGFDFFLICVKLKSMLLGRAIRSIFSILGWPFLGLFLCVASFFGAELFQMIGPESASGASPSGLEQREEELALTNLEGRGGHLGQGQEVKEVRQTVEGDFHVHTVTDQFQLAQQMEREVGNIKKEECPATHSIFNAVKEHQSHVQDGRGGGKPFDSSNREEGKTHEL